MKVSVDNNLCSGHARCHANAPEVYDLDDDGYCNIGQNKEVPPELEAAAVKGANACPERAITVTK